MNSQGNQVHLQNTIKLVDELKYHANIQRIPVSSAAKQLVQFVDENHNKDFLLVKPHDNPFKPKSSCMVL